MCPPLFPSFVIAAIVIVIIGIQFVGNSCYLCCCCCCCSFQWIFREIDFRPNDSKPDLNFSFDRNANKHQNQYYSFVLVSLSQQNIFAKSQKYKSAHNAIVFECYETILLQCYFFFFFFGLFFLVADLIRILQYLEY